jgi:Xaa-Pro aminopeptidase
MMLPGLGDLLRRLGADWAVLSAPEAVAWATGHPIPIETGPSPFTGGPALVLVDGRGAVGLVCANVEAFDLPAGLEVEVYWGFAASVTPQVANYRDAVERMCRRLGVSGRLAVQVHRHPASLADILTGPQVDIGSDLDRLMAVKTPFAVIELRRAAKVTDEAQMAARHLSRSGQSELGVLNGVRAIIEQAAGQRCALAGEYTSGIANTAIPGHPPGRRVLQRGDPVICDLAPRVGAWWGDSCAAFALGPATDAWLRLWHRTAETLALAEATLRPGLRICDLDDTLRAHMQGGGYAYPHHSGHGIGTSVHEWPRIVPDERAEVEAGMVLMVEPGAYLPEIGGVRLERMFLVTATGCESLTRFMMEPSV